MEQASTGYPGNRRDLERLRWLIFLRLFVVSFLVGIAAVIQASGDDALSYRSLYLLFAVIGCTYPLSLLYMLLTCLGVSTVMNASVQSAVDVVLITTLVYATGGAGSSYSILYPLVIMYAALFLGRRGSLMVASLAAICYGGLVDLEYFGYIPPIHEDPYYRSFTAGHVFSRIFIHIVFFYIVAVIAFYVVEREQKTKSLLSEREDSFRRLDILHRSIIESVDVGIVTVDMEGTVRSFNRAAEMIIGCRRDQAMGRNIKHLFPALSGIPNDGGVRRIPVSVEAISKGAGEKPLGCSLSTLLDPAMNRIGAIIVFQDLTDIKTMERELEKSKRMAFLGKMAAVLTHELRNPLASISGSVQLLRRDLNLEAGDRKLLDIIERGRNELETLVGDFLLLSRSRGMGSYEEIDLVEIIDETIDSIRLGGEWNEGVSLIRRYDDDRLVRGKKSEVRQAVMNITVNALQAMQEGGELTIETRRKDVNGGAYLEVEVRDDGTGIDEKYLGIIREPFFTTRETGTGLGLVIVDRVMENHGGYFHIENMTGRGVRAVVGFPIQAAD